MKQEFTFIKIITCCFVLFSFSGNAIAQTTSAIKNKGDLAEYLWYTCELQWERDMMKVLATDSSGMQEFLIYNKIEYYKDRGEFFIDVSQGIIDACNAGRFFDSLRNKYVALYHTFYEIKAEHPDMTGANNRGPSTSAPSSVQSTCNPSCSNIGFQNSTLSSWSAYYGVDGSKDTAIIVNSLTGGTCGSVVQAGGPDPNTGNDYQVSLMTTAGTDPVGGALIPYTPPLGGICARVGDGPINGYGVGLLQQTYMVDASNPILTVQYAVVLENPGHPGYQQPWFRISLLDQNNIPIPGCAQYFVVAGPGNPGFKAVWYAQGYDTVYVRPWTTAFVPLNNYIGQCVTIQYEASDCAWGGHFGYAYVAATCSKLDLVSSSDIFCNGQKSATITGPPGSATYQWTTPDGCISGSSTQQVLNVNCAGTYNLVTVSSAGAQCVDSFTITMPPSVAGPPPVPCFTADTVCSGNPTHFNALCSNPNSGGVKFYWDFYNNGIYEDSSGAVTSWTYSTGGIYKSRLHILSNNGCSADTLVTVAVDSTDLTTFPTFSDSVINTTSCNACNGGVYLNIIPNSPNGSAGNGAYYIITNSFSNYRDSVNGYSAKGSGSGTCDTSITGALGVSGTTNKGEIRLGFTDCLCPGTYYFTIISSKGTKASKCNPGGLIGDTVQFVVGSFGANISGNVTTSSTSCGNNNGSATVTGLGGTTPYIYTWSNGLGTGSAKTNLAAGIYTVAIEDSNNCMGSASVNILSSSQLPAVVTPYYITCFGAHNGSIKVTPGGGLFPYTYRWTGSVGTTDSIGGLAPGSYSVTVTDAGGCSGTFLANIIQPSQLRDSIVSSVTTIACSGKGNATYGVKGGSLPYAFKWSDGATSPTDTALTAGTTKITIADASGCSIVDSVTVTATNGFSINAGSDTVICLNDSIQINVSGVPGGSSISWLPVTGLSCNNCPNPFAKPSASTNYVVTAVKDSCMSSDTILVSVSPAIAAKVIPIDTIVCAGSFVQLQASGGSIYKWKPTKGLNDSTIVNPVAYVTTAITYTVTVSRRGCSGDDAFAAIDVYPATPDPNITESNDTLYCTTSPVYASYQWYFNDTLIAGSTDTTCIANKSGNYNVAVTDTNGCAIAVGINLIISGMENHSSLSSIMLSPNPVTNELLISGNWSVETQNFASLTIFNVLGEIIYEKRLYAKSHAYEVNCKPFPSGIYFVQVSNGIGNWVGKFVKE